MDALKQSLQHELAFIWAAHAAVGLDGYMCLYTEAEAEPWRAKDKGIQHWFSIADTDGAIDVLLEHYNAGALPNSTLLLNPIVHTRTEAGYTPVGSGVCWATGLAMGVAKLVDEQTQRLQDKGVLSSYLHRGENPRAGIKMLGVADTLLSVCEDGKTVTGCREMYELSNVQSEAYAPYYVLSGMNYLSANGIFMHPDFRDMYGHIIDSSASANSELIKQAVMSMATLQDAATCWNAYDRLHTLYMHFGQDTDHIEHNNRFFNLCARDLDLFDRTGPMRKGAGETFEFVVPGYIPRGAVTLLAAAGGTGKSSVAHQLCVMASIERGNEADKPVWLGQELNLSACKGICVYFSGEDGPAIINARGSLFDPDQDALRLQFHRTEFLDREMSFAEYLEDLKKMPDVSIVVIDPARKYLSGDENDADVVSEFFEAIEEFAISKNCAMIVVHHLQKGARPTNAREVLDELRGSQVFIDRPRVVLGMCRDHKHTIVGLSKCNIPPNLGMVMDERVFTRNPDTLELMWLPGDAGVRRDYMTEEELDQLQQLEELEVLNTKKEGSV